MPLNYTKQERFTDACRIADIRTMKKYIKHGIDVNYSSSKPPVVEAIKSGSLDAVKLLVENGADVFCYVTAPTPLHHAAHTGNKEMFLYLIERGAYISDEQGMFQKACLSGDIELVEYLLNDNIEINELCLKYACKSENIELVKKLIKLSSSAYQKNLLPEAIKVSYPEMVQFFIEQGEDISQATDDGTPIEIASNSRFEDITARRYIMGSPRNDKLFKLLKQAVKVNDLEILADYREDILLECFIQFDNDMQKITDILTSRGAIKPDIQPESILEGRGNFDLFKIAELIRHGADIYESDETGSVIAHAVCDNNQNVVKLLIKCGIDINSLNETDCMFGKAGIRLFIQNGGEVKDAYDFYLNPVYYIAENNYTAGLEIILKKYPDINRAWDTKGNTLLHYAAGYFGTDGIATLLKLGADVNSRNNKGETPIMCADDKDIVNYLVAAGADINAEDNEGNTALYSSLTNHDQNHSLLRSLINNGADINHQNKEGNTPLHVYINNHSSQQEYYIADRGC